jgi:enolase-phosphatase E1
VRISLRDAGVRVVLLDIEGTTTPIAFVHDVLFPYARKRAESYLLAAPDDPERDALVRHLHDEHARDQAAGEHPPALAADHPRRAIVAYIHWLMDRDRKSTPLKALQGRIWEDGYRRGELKGDVYEDVPAALARWTRGGVRVAIFSSGSVLAQQLLFSCSTAGDLSRYLDGYFDTTVGAKREAASYRRIAAALDTEPKRMLFISDVAAELDAAREAGLQVLLCVRPPGAVTSPSAIDSFNSIDA